VKRGKKVVEKGKSTDSLMRHIRDAHSIEINGSNDKKDLLMMGYYHGYKGYRFARNINNKLAISKFEEITAIYNFDMSIKSLFYSPIMKVETAIKNYVIDDLVAGSEFSFEAIFDEKLNYYKTTVPSDRNYKKLVKKRLMLRKKIQTTILFEYSNDNPVIRNFVHKDKPVPLWAIFEVVSMGTLGNFYQCLNIQTRKQILEHLDIIETYLDFKRTSQCFSS
jgi:abortive infection bacteriophage resistance protein